MLERLANSRYLNILTLVGLADGIPENENDAFNAILSLRNKDCSPTN